MAHRSDDTEVELALVDDGKRRLRVEAPDLAAGDYPIGTRYEVWVGGEADDDRARVVAWPYDPVEPIVWATLPLLVALGWLAQRAAATRDVKTAARSGPWRRIRATVEPTHDAVALGLIEPGGSEIGAVRCSGIADRLVLSEVELIVAGEPGPGSPVALWRSDGRPIVVGSALRPPGAFPTDSYDADIDDLESFQSLDSAKSSGSPRLVLAHFRWVRTANRPFVRVVGGTMVIFVPQWFGRRMWRIPVKEVAVVDMRTAVTSCEIASATAESSDDAVLAERPIVPNLVTARAGAAPTTALLFRTPQRFPPLRWLLLGSIPELGLLESRASRGAFVDGVEVRFVDPERALSTLVESGVECAADSGRWMRSHRDVVTDPVEAIEISSRELRRTRVEVLTLLAIVAGALYLRFFTGDDPSWWSVGLGLTLTVGSATVRFVFRLVDRRRRGRSRNVFASD
ncbi:MAG: hypothetical protein E6Q57_18115 [Mycobacterium sp.]|nr:MAG: hypothetical protein E6Q57_18115 [Mycobacterium sp.]